MDLARCGEIGRSQDGLITRTQAMQFLSENQIDGLLRRNMWTRLHSGVYVSSSNPATSQQKIRSATLAKAGASIASHRSAAYLLGLLERPSRFVDILVPYGISTRVPGVVVHRTRSWHGDIATGIDSIPCTTPARTVIDLTAVVGIGTLRHAVDLGITSKVLRLDDIADELELIGPRGRSRCSHLYDVLTLRTAAFEKTDHLSEAELLAAILEAGLPAPIPQFRIPLGRSLTARPDFAYPDKKIAIEAVSWRWHGGPNKFEDDAKRRLRMRTAGWLVVEISRKTSKRDATTAIESALRERP